MGGVGSGLKGLGTSLSKGGKDLGVGAKWRQS